MSGPCLDPVDLSPNHAKRSPLYVGGFGIARFRGTKATTPLLPDDCVGSATTQSGEEATCMTRLNDGRFLTDAIEKDPAGNLGPEHVATFGTSTGIPVKLLDSANRLGIKFHPTTTSVGSISVVTTARPKCGSPCSSTHPRSKARCGSPSPRTSTPPRLADWRPCAQRTSRISVTSTSSSPGKHLPGTSIPQSIPWSLPMTSIVTSPPITRVEPERPGADAISPAFPTSQPNSGFRANDSPSPDLAGIGKKMTAAHYTGKGTGASW